MSDTLAIPQSGIVNIAGRSVRGAINPAFDPEEETKAWLFRELGPLDDIELFFNDVLVAKHVRQQVAKGVIAAALTNLEDQWQGVVGCVLKVGPTAFQDDEHNKFRGITVKPGDWVLYRNSDGWDKNIARLGETAKEPVQCRIIQDAHIRGRVKYPGRLY